MNNEKKQEKQKEPQNEQKSQQLKMRQIIIATDGNNIKLIKNETAGNLELMAVLSAILNKLQQAQR